LELSVYGNQTRALTEENYTGVRNSDGTTISKTGTASKPSVNVGGSVLATWYQLNKTVKELSVGVSYDFAQTFSRATVVGSRQTVTSTNTTTPPPFTTLNWGGSATYNFGYSGASVTNPLFQNPPGTITYTVSSTSTDGQPASNSTSTPYNFNSSIPFTFGQSGAGPILAGFIKPAAGFSATTNITFNIPYYTGVVTNGVPQVANYAYTISYVVTNPGGITTATPLPRPTFNIPPINESVTQPPIDMERKTTTQRMEVFTNMKLNIIKGKNEKGEDDPKALSKLLLDFTFATQFNWQKNQYTADTETARQYLVANGIITPDENSFDVRFLTELMLNYRLGALNLLGGLGTRDLLGNEDSHYFKLGASIRFSDLFKKGNQDVSREGWDFLMSAVYTSTLKQSIAWAKGESSDFSYDARARLIAEYTPIAKKYFEKAQFYSGLVQNHTLVPVTKSDVNAGAHTEYVAANKWLVEFGTNITNVLGSNFDGWFNIQVPVSASGADTNQTRFNFGATYRPQVSGTDRDRNKEKHMEASKAFRELTGEPFNVGTFEEVVMKYMEKSQNHEGSFLFFDSNAEKLRNALIEMSQRTANESESNRRVKIREFLKQKLFIRYPKLDKNIDHV
jgi:hypothetical protein